ncbi:DUF6371 domain-containing protein [Chitinophaga defluvii]|uniref:DUF6371 domain-containing protein n=1 Tax=Chitinophaga defluvii TaxID=3163343 RepID=A0ABV2T8W5_9BACT
MNNHRFILQSYSGPASRYRCPACNKQREFTRYIDTETGELLPEYVGRCNRESNCGFHYTPKQYFDDNKEVLQQFQQPISKVRPVKQHRTIDYLPDMLLSQTLTAYDSNNFLLFLRSLFCNELSNKLVALYKVGTSRHWPGANVFWQIDIVGKLRQAKVMCYDAGTGRRNKEKGAFFAGKKLLSNYDANLQQCFFGEHLLPGNDYPVAIVESEKTAIIAKAYFSGVTWLATGGINGCKWTDPNVYKVLKGRTVILFPDLGCFDKWQFKAREVAKSTGCKVVVSDLLEKNATDAQHTNGWDLADYLLLNRDSTGVALTVEGYPTFWDNPLK